MAYHTQHSRLKEATNVALKDSLHGLKRRGASVVRVGTFFSGTEVARHSMETCFALWGQLYNVTLEVEHVFSIEHTGWIRDFIRQHFKPRHLFDCVLKMAADGWRGTDLLTGQRGVSLPDIDILFAGFECDDASTLNTSRGMSGNEVEFGLGRTGGTGLVTLHFVVSRRCRALLENLKTIGAANIRFIIKFCNEHLMLVLCPMMSAIRYGAPMRRERQWFYITPVTSPIDQLAEEYEPPAWEVKFFDTLTCMQIEPIPLADFLLPEDDNGLAAHIARCGSAEPTEQTDKDRYKQDHVTMYVEAGLLWPPRLPTWFMDRLGYLTARYREVAWYYVCLARRQAQEHEWVHDLNLSLGWNSTAKDSCPCATCLSTFLLTQRLRVISWWEAMRMQGWLVHRIDILALSQRTGMELAGNAFSGFVINPLLVASLAHDASWGQLEKCADEGVDVSVHSSSDGVDSYDSGSDSEESEMLLLG